MFKRVLLFFSFACVVEVPALFFFPLCQLPLLSSLRLRAFCLSIELAVFFFFFLPLSPFLLSHLFLLSSVHFPSFIHTHTHTWHTHTLIMSQHAPSPVELFHKMPLTHERGLFERNCCSQPIMHAIMSSGDSDTAPSSPDSDIGSADTAAWAYGYPSNERSTTQPTAPTSQPPQSRNVPPPSRAMCTALSA